MKNYVGSGKAITTQHGGMLKISFNKSDLDRMQAALNEKGWVNLDCSKRKEVSQYGQTHSIWIDEFVPTPQGSQNLPPADNNLPDDDIPF